MREVQVDDVVIERLGAARASALRAELGPVDLELVDAEELEVLRTQAAGYRRLAALVEDVGPTER